MDKLENKNNVIFDEHNGIVIDSNAVLQLNISSFNLSLDVDKAAFAAKEHARQSVLGDSSVNSFSAVANYDLGVFQSRVKNAKDSSSSYFNLDALFAAAGHHFNVNGSVYSI